MRGHWLVSVFWVLTATSAFAQNALPDQQADVTGVIVEAEDTTKCRVDGTHLSAIYPRSVGRKCVILDVGSKLTVTGTGRAVYLRLPTMFQTPGPRYADFTGSQLQVRIDRGDWKTVTLATTRQEWPLAEDLPEGSHQVEVVAINEPGAVDGFRFAQRPLNALFGSIFTAAYSELLTDVRVDVSVKSKFNPLYYKFLRTEYVRSPLTGTFEIWGLEEGTYQLVISADGWQSATVSDVEVFNVRNDAGQITDSKRVDIGAVLLKRDPRCGGRNLQEVHGPRFGQSQCVKPGDSFTVPINFVKGASPTAQLVSRFRTIEVPVSDSRELNFGRWNHIGTATFLVPASTPNDLYDLHVTFPTKGPNGNSTPVTTVLGQAVCVRGALPERFHVAGCGHMNTWGQQTAEYLGRVAEVAELAGARLLLVSNEVNAAYVSGALRQTRIPYVVTRGNHTQPRWDEFYGATSTAFDDGPLRAVTFGRWPYESWHSAERLFLERPQATNRILLCYEGYAPAKLLRDAQVDLLFDAHSDDQHPEAADFPPGMIKVRAPTQETLRWIPMTANGIDSEIKQPADIPVLNVPRTGPAPLRVSQLRGGPQEQSVVVTNEYPQAFPEARVRLVVKAGQYEVKGAKVQQSFNNDSGTSTVLDLQLDLKAKSESTVTITPQ